MNAIAKRLLAIKSHPRYFMKYCVYTKDGNDLESPCKQFPWHLEYHSEICNLWHEARLFIIEKSRQMQVTWHMLGLHLWLGLTGAEREIYFRRQTFDDALKLLEDLEYLYDHIPEEIWPKDLLPQKYTKEGFFKFPEINTTFYAVSSGRDKMRGRTPTAVLLDEFAFQEEDAMVYQTLKPAFQGDAKISIVSTPRPLFAGDDPQFRKIMQDRG